VECLDWRKEAIDEADEALPGEVSLLASSPKRRAPAPDCKNHQTLGWFSSHFVLTMPLSDAAEAAAYFAEGIDMKFAFIAKHRGISLLKPPFRGGLNHPRRETAVKATFGRFGLIRFHDYVADRIAGRLQAG
jgi:hypothetical protein